MVMLPPDWRNHSFMGCSSRLLIILDPVKKVIIRPVNGSIDFIKRGQRTNHEHAN